MLVAVLLAGCGSEPRRPAVPPTYTVRAGDTVYSIAWRHDLDYRELARWNALVDYRIVPGQVLRLAPASGATVVTPVATAKSPAAANAVIDWSWPTEGRVTGTVRQPAGGLGLTIEGREGQVVRAAAAGRVVYTGAGLRSYGQLVIVKHEGDFLSAYGYNATVAVAEGEAVACGQPIATMGQSKGRPTLYFELRRNGRPLDPTAFLPSR